METTLYKVTFKDGRKYKINCANKAQKNRFMASVRDFTGYVEVEEAENGIHNINQWEQIVAEEDTEPFFPKSLETGDTMRKYRA